MNVQHLPQSGHIPSFFLPETCLEPLSFPMPSYC
jgi:hypothetical protein